MPDRDPDTGQFLPEAPAAAPAAIPEQTPKPETYEVTVDGVVRQVTLDEMRRGFSFQEYNTRRAAQLNEREQELDRRERAYAAPAARFQPGAGEYHQVEPSERVIGSGPAAPDAFGDSPDHPYGGPPTGGYRNPPPPVNYEPQYGDEEAPYREIGALRRDLQALTQQNQRMWQQMTERQRAMEHQRKENESLDRLAMEVPELDFGTVEHYVAVQATPSERAYLTSLPKATAFELVHRRYFGGGAGQGQATAPPAGAPHAEETPQTPFTESERSAGPTPRQAPQQVSAGAGRGEIEGFVEAYNKMTATGKTGEPTL